MTNAAKPMRVCIVTRALPVHRLGGLEFHTLDLARALAELGHDLTIVTTALPAVPQDKFDVEASGMKLVTIPDTRPGDYSISFWRRLSRMINRLHAQRPFDIVHCQEFAGLFLHNLHAPLLHTVHGTMFTETPLHPRYRAHSAVGARASAAWRFRKRIALNPFFVRMLRRSDGLICDSAFTRGELRGIDPRLDARTAMIPLGIDWRRYSPAQTGSPRDGNQPLRIGVLGRLQEMKGIGVALEAAHDLARSGAEFEMRIAGTGDYQASAERIIAERGLQRQVRLTGRLYSDQTSAFFEWCDVFLFPDLTQPAFGLVALEAMGHGVPVIGARSGAIPETVDDSVGWLYEPWSASELAHLLGRLTKHREEIGEKAARTIAHARAFTAESMARQVESVYARTLSK